MAFQKELLRDIYDVYGRWAERFPLACSRGCSVCCTASVTMTSLEGELILDLIRKEGRERWFRQRLSLAPPGKSRPEMTMNGFAGACLSRQEVGGGGEESWDFTPCVFLEVDICTIYEARPFGCRSFGSLVRCAPGREAEMAPIHLAVNTVFTQIIEHVCSSGACWSTMTDILHSLAGSGSCKAGAYLLPARPVPGFLLAPREARLARALLQELRGRVSARETVGDLIDNFMPME